MLNADALHPAQARARSGRRFCFTLNNPDGIPTLETFGATCRFLCYGEEFSAEGTPHLQGYVEFTNSVKFTTVLNFLPDAHFEIARGTAEENIAYCSKTGPNFFHRYGAPGGGQGRRSDIAEVAEKILAKRPLAEIANLHPVAYIRYYRGATALRNITSTPYVGPREIFVLYGPSGTGKTRWAHDHCGPNAYWKSPGQWYDLYDQHDTLVLDEFTGTFMPYRDLLRLLDRYPFMCQVKGGHTWHTARRIIITSNFPPHSWYPDDNGFDYTGSPLDRRIKEYGVIFTQNTTHLFRDGVWVTQAGGYGYVEEEIPLPPPAAPVPPVQEVVLVPATQASPLYASPVRPPREVINLVNDDDDDEVVIVDPPPALGFRVDGDGWPVFEDEPEFEEDNVRSSQFRFKHPRRTNLPSDDEDDDDDFDSSVY